MPSPYIINFAGGVLAIAPFGQRDKFRFVGTWTAGDTWTVEVTSTLQGDFTLGLGNIANKNPTVALKLRNRIYLGIGDEFALCANGDVTAWEEQDSGAAVIPYLSQFGVQDSVTAISALTGRLAVFGRQSIQLWTVDADPANLALQQTLDQTGTNAPLSVKSIGDLDVLYLHDSGIRSLRANQMYLNATTNDIGTAIDLLIRAALVNFDESGACAIVEPTTKQYWLYLNGNIYVLSNYPESKIIAWSTYKATTVSTSLISPVGSFNAVYSGLTIGAIYYWTKPVDLVSLTNGTQVFTTSRGFVATAITATEAGAPPGTLTRLDSAFTPEKLVVYNGQVYIRGVDRKIYQYGGTDNNTFDQSLPVVELPWLDMKEASMVKQAHGIDAAFSGKWEISASMNPRTTAYTPILNRGGAVSPSMVVDSTFDVGHFGMSGTGTHLKIKAIGAIAAEPAKLGKLIFLYDNLNIK